MRSAQRDQQVGELQEVGRIDDLPQDRQLVAPRCGS
jgi:hypothetical protein